MPQLNIYKLYQDSLDEINQEERGQLSVPLFNRLANKSVRWLIDMLTGRTVEGRDTGLGLLKTQKIADLLYPIMKRSILQLDTGTIPYPSDYEYLLDLRLSREGLPHICGPAEPPSPLTINAILAGAMGFRQVDVLSHDRIPHRVESAIPGLRERPSAEMLAEGFRLYPYRDGGTAYLLYLRTPVEGQLVMTLDAQFQTLVYDPVASRDMEVHEKVGYVLAQRIAQYFAVYVREAQVLQMSEALRKND